jgi:hypothetical protein
MGLTFIFPIWEKVSYGMEEAVRVSNLAITHYKFSGTEYDAVGEVLRTESLWYAALLAGLSMVVAILSTFSFRKRLNQIKLNALNSLLIGGYLVSVLLASIRGDEWLVADGEGNYLPGFYIPLVALILNMLANRFIRKDEMLVRSAERFR